MTKPGHVSFLAPLSRFFPATEWLDSCGVPHEFFEAWIVRQMKDHDTSFILTVPEGDAAVMLLCWGFEQINLKEPNEEDEPAKTTD